MSDRPETVNGFTIESPHWIDSEDCMGNPERYWRCFGNHPVRRPVCGVGDSPEQARADAVTRAMAVNLSEAERPRRIALKAGFPTIVTLCGSTRFADEFIAAARAETLAGRIVISVGLFGHQEGLDMGGATKAGLDELHLRKIDLADEILVIAVSCRKCPSCGIVRRETEGTDCSCGMDISWILPGLYTGESTRREIDYATKAGKTIRYYSEEISRV